MMGRGFESRLHWAYDPPLRTPLDMTSQGRSVRKRPCALMTDILPEILPFLMHPIVTSVY